MDANDGQTDNPEHRRAQLLRELGYNKARDISDLQRKLQNNYLDIILCYEFPRTPRTPFKRLKGPLDSLSKNHYLLFLEQYGSLKDLAKVQDGAKNFEAALSQARQLIESACGPLPKSFTFEGSAAQPNLKSPDQEEGLDEGKKRKHCEIGESIIREKKKPRMLDQMAEDIQIRLCECGDSSLSLEGYADLLRILEKGHGGEYGKYSLTFLSFLMKIYPSETLSEIIPSLPGRMTVVSKEITECLQYIENWESGGRIHVEFPVTGSERDKIECLVMWDFLMGKYGPLERYKFDGASSVHDLAGQRREKWNQLDEDGLERGFNSLMSEENMIAFNQKTSMNPDVLGSELVWVENVKNEVEKGFESQVATGQAHSEDQSGQEDTSKEQSAREGKSCFHPNLQSAAVGPEPCQGLADVSRLYETLGYERGSKGCEDGDISCADPKADITRLEMLVGSTVEQEEALQNERESSRLLREALSKEKTELQKQKEEVRNLQERLQNQQNQAGENLRQKEEEFQHLLKEKKELVSKSGDASQEHLSMSKVVEETTGKFQRVIGMMRQYIAQEEPYMRQKSEDALFNPNEASGDELDDGDGGEPRQDNDLKYAIDFFDAIEKKDGWHRECIWGLQANIEKCVLEKHSLETQSNELKRLQQQQSQRIEVLECGAHGFAQEKADLQSRIGRLEKELQEHVSLRDGNLKIIENTKNELSSLQKASAELQQKHKIATQSTAEEMEEQMGQMKRENERLRAENGLLRSEKEAMSVQSECRGQIIADLTNLEREHEVKIETLNKENQENHELQEKLARRQAETVQKRSEEYEKSEQERRTLKDEIGSLQRKQNELRQDKDVLQQEKSDLLEQVNELSRQKEDLEADSNAKSEMILDFESGNLKSSQAIEATNKRHQAEMDELSEESWKKCESAIDGIKQQHQIELMSSRLALLRLVRILLYDGQGPVPCLVESCEVCQRSDPSCSCTHSADEGEMIGLLRSSGVLSGPAESLGSVFLPESSGQWVHPRVLDLMKLADIQMARDQVALPCSPEATMLATIFHVIGTFHSKTEELDILNQRLTSETTDMRQRLVKLEQTCSQATEKLEIKTAEYENDNSALRQKLSEEARRAEVKEIQTELEIAGQELSHQKQDRNGLAGTGALNPESEANNARQNATQNELAQEQAQAVQQLLEECGQSEQEQEVLRDEIQRVKQQRNELEQERDALQKENCTLSDQVQNLSREAYRSKEESISQSERIMGLRLRISRRHQQALRRHRNQMNQSQTARKDRATAIQRKEQRRQTGSESSRLALLRLTRIFLYDGEGPIPCCVVSCEACQLPDLPYSCGRFLNAEGIIELLKASGVLSSSSESSGSIFLPDSPNHTFHPRIQELMLQVDIQMAKDQVLLSDGPEATAFQTILHIIGTVYSRVVEMERLFANKEQIYAQSIALLEKEKEECENNYAALQQKLSQEMKRAEVKESRNKSKMARWKSHGDSLMQEKDRIGLDLKETKERLWEMDQRYKELEENSGARILDLEYDIRCKEEELGSLQHRFSTEIEDFKKRLSEQRENVGQDYQSQAAGSRQLTESEHARKLQQSRLALMRLIRLICYNGEGLMPCLITNCTKCLSSGTLKDLSHHPDGRQLLDLLEENGFQRSYTGAMLTFYSNPPEDTKGLHPQVLDLMKQALGGLDQSRQDGNAGPINPETDCFQTLVQGIVALRPDGKFYILGERLLKEREDKVTERESLIAKKVAERQHETECNVQAISKLESDVQQQKDHVKSLLTERAYHEKSLRNLKNDLLSKKLAEENSQREMRDLQEHMLRSKLALLELIRIFLLYSDKGSLTPCCTENCFACQRPVYETDFSHPPNKARVLSLLEESGLLHDNGLLVNSDPPLDAWYDGLRAKTLDCVEQAQGVPHRVPEAKCFVSLLSTIGLKIRDQRCREQELEKRNLELQGLVEEREKEWGATNRSSQRRALGDVFSLLLERNHNFAHYNEVVDGLLEEAGLRCGGVVRALYATPVGDAFSADINLPETTDLYDDYKPLFTYIEKLHGKVMTTPRLFEERASPLDHSPKSTPLGWSLEEDFHRIDEQPVRQNASGSPLSREPEDNGARKSVPVDARVTSNHHTEAQPETSGLSYATDKDQIRFCDVGLQVSENLSGWFTGQLESSLREKFLSEEARYNSRVTALQDELEALRKQQENQEDSVHKFLSMSIAAQGPNHPNKRRSWPATGYTIPDKDRPSEPASEPIWKVSFWGDSWEIHGVESRHSSQHILIHRAVSERVVKSCVPLLSLFAMKDGAEARRNAANVYSYCTSKGYENIPDCVSFESATEVDWRGKGHRFRVTFREERSAEKTIAASKLVMLGSHVAEKMGPEWLKVFLESDTRLSRVVHLHDIRQKFC